MNYKKLRENIKKFQKYLIEKKDKLGNYKLKLTKINNSYIS